MRRQSRQKIFTSVTANHPQQRRAAIIGAMKRYIRRRGDSGIIALASSSSWYVGMASLALRRWQADSLVGDLLMHQQLMLIMAR